MYLKTKLPLRIIAVHLRDMSGYQIVSLRIPTFQLRGMFGIQITSQNPNFSRKLYVWEAKMYLNFTFVEVRNRTIKLYYFITNLQRFIIFFGNWQKCKNKLKLGSRYLFKSLWVAIMTCHNITFVQHVGNWGELFFLQIILTICAHFFAIFGQCICCWYFCNL